MIWLNSPAKYVLRNPLARTEQESGHATNIVGYEAGVRLKCHSHPESEEILVLTGICSDGNGNYDQGRYIRNPAGTGHAPFSEKGCTLFVKLHQFEVSDRKQFVINT